MTIRRLLIAALLASAGAAHADPITAQVSSTAPKFVAGWTTGNGTDVLGSGVLAGSLNLIGGVAYANGGGANASLEDVLYGKVAGTVGQENGKTKLFFKRGIEANYLLASGHGILAATVGPGKSVVGSADGAIISDGVASGGRRPGGTGGFGGTGDNGGFTGGFGGSGGFSGGSGGGDNFSGDAGFSGGSGETSDVSSGGGNGDSSGATSGGGTGTQQSRPSTVRPSLVQPQAVAIPEPSSIALMLLGLAGAGSMVRRRKA